MFTPEASIFLNMKQWKYLELKGFGLKKYFISIFSKEKQQQKFYVDFVVENYKILSQKQKLTNGN